MHNYPSNIPDSASLTDGTGAPWNRAVLEQRVRHLCEALQSRRQPKAPVAILADNSPEWIAVDLATQALGITFIPLPSFFTPAQWMHAIAASGVQAVFCAQASHGAALGFSDVVPCDSTLLLCQRPQGNAQENVQEKARLDLESVQKITFTSGTTSEPKGVCLSSEQQWDVAQALHASLGSLGIKRHLCLLPLPVLLENIAGVYTALLAGATTICPPLAETGLSGASQFDPRVCLDAIQRYEAESIILLPQMLQALVAVAASNDERIRSLKFVAVGGAKTPAALIKAARDKGFPVYEGYGLSECGSVVSLNLPGADLPGSAGKPLPNRLVRIAAGGEIEVGGKGIAHYLGETRKQIEWLPTGDIGRLDAAGFLHISGRKKNILITAFGRNVSPEWPESALIGTGLVAQAVVFGDARPYLVAAIVPMSAQVPPAALHAAVDRVNENLPDYAQIRRWIAVEPFAPVNGLATANGRPRRDAIWQRYQQQIESLYDTRGE
ncbi:MAG TPA: AMP-binding protein [Noviherbaspirillum sp.]|nr:AMP-binding protein [Noviherbaspirillum sp.]